MTTAGSPDHHDTDTISHRHHDGKLTTDGITMADNSGDAETGVPTQFERNHYFHGKLMTARDMATEQGYHRGRLEAVTRCVLGVGVVTGLEVTDIDEQDGQLRASIDPGVAIDAGGRAVVVPPGTGPVTVQRQGDTAAFPADEIAVGETVSLNLRYDACSTERVPVTGREHGRGAATETNRVVESFVVEARVNGDGDRPKPISEVDLPGPDQTPDEDGRRLATESFDRSLSPTSLLLATVTRTAEDTWSVNMDVRPLVYPNDLVYATAVTHATDRDNPHGVDVGQVDGAVASVGGVVPDADGAIDVRSESSTASVSTEENTLIFDSDALRSVDVQGSGTVQGNTDSVLRFTSPNDSVAISVDTEGHAVGFRATVDLDGVLFELGGLSDHGGSIEFISSNDSVVVEQADDDQLDVRIADSFAGEIKEQMKRLHLATETLSAQLVRLTKAVDPPLHPVTVLDGLELSHASLLLELDVVTLEDLVDADPSDVASVTGVSEEQAKKWVDEARGQL
jgi:hypothetical protein